MTRERSQDDPADGPPATGGDIIAHLLRVAGPRPLAPEARMARVKEAVRSRWLEAVERKGSRLSSRSVSD